MRMSQESYRTFQDVLRTETGYALSDDKEYLIRSRLTPLADQLGLRDLDALALELRRRINRQAMQGVIDRMTTHETSFFRDQTPFENLEQSVLPTLLEGKSGAERVIRIWSAACSTGQEPYSLAMVLRDCAAKLGGFSYEIIATDVSAEAVDAARAGVYSDFEVGRGLEGRLRERYMSRQEDGRWRIGDEIRANIQFKTDNLMMPSVPRSYFDIIFCRNVLIYFDVDTKRKVLDRLVEHFRRRDGVLILGAAETTVGVSERFSRPDDKRFAVFRPIAA